VKLPVEPDGIAAATFWAKPQLVAELTARVVDPGHNVAPAGGNASDGVADGVTEALCAGVDVLGAAVADADVVAAADFDGLFTVVGEPPPVNQRMPPAIAATTSRTNRRMTPRAPERPL
jgi:hypothetical protein